MHLKAADFGFLGIYAVAMATEFYVEYIKWDAGRIAVKPTVIILLILYYLIKLQNVPSKFKNYVLIALLLSLCGDVSLLFEENHELFFIGGLASFLLAHILYIIGFTGNAGESLHKKHKNTEAEGVRVAEFILFGILPFYLLTSTAYLGLRDYLGDLGMPVIIYMLVIASMGAAAAFRYYFTTTPSFLFILFGAIIFMVSDLSLAMRKFLKIDPRWMMGLINTTYYIAQYLIALGAMSHIFDVEGRPHEKEAAKKEKKH